MEKHIITRMGILNAQVCSTGTYDEALEFLRATSPAGTANNWVQDERPEVAPIQCEEYADRMHYVYTC